jgi:TolB-like protein/DNA-binding winged helix-turn-helix (wHTH) protein/Tfp pilus assembly protein PilF
VTEQPTYLFESFRLDAQRRVLSRDGEPIPLAPKALDTLVHLIEHRGELLDKRALLEAIWLHVVVEENNLNQTISALRRVLGERPGEHRFIVTEPGRGYRFVASVSVLPDSETSAAAERPVTPKAPDVALTSSGSAARRTPIYAVAALSFVLLLLGLALYLTQDDSPVLPNSVAVLPFTNLSPNADDAYFTAGLHAETVNQLAQVSGLNVIGLPSVLRYADSERSAREIAAELNVQTALVADVRSADGRVRITARLIEAATGRIAWTNAYEHNLDAIFAIQSEIATAVTDALRTTLWSGEKQESEMALTDSPDAYLAYLRALGVWDRRRSSSLVLEYLDEAIRFDREFAAAHAKKAAYYAGSLRSQFGDDASPSELAELERLARESAETALNLDRNMWIAHEALGEIHEQFWRWTEALREYEQAARVTPKGLRRPYDFMRARTGDSTFEDSIRAQQQVIELNPYVAEEHWVLGLYYAYSHDAESAVAEMREAVELEPSDALFHLWLAHAEGMAGNRTAALQSLKHAEELEGVYDSSITIANLAYAYAQNGRPDQARRLFEQFASKAPDRRFEAGNWALAHLAVGDEHGARGAHVSRFAGVDALAMAPLEPRQSLACTSMFLHKRCRGSKVIAVVSRPDSQPFHRGIFLAPSL